MRALLVTTMWPTPDRPALGSFVRTQAEALAQAGVDVEVLVLRSRVRGMKYLWGVPLLRAALRRARFDVVHAHFGYVGVVAATQRRLPIVVTCHGDDLLGTVRADGTHSPSSLAAAAVVRALAERVDAVIVQTEEMARRLRRRDVDVIPHEVDLDLFRPCPRDAARAALGLDPARRYLLFAASPHVPVKRFPLAAEVARTLAAEDPRVELLVAHRERQARLALLFSACDALIFPSFQEGSPNVVKQAMACNLPVVATDVGDVRRVIGGTSHCHVCPPRADAFVERLRPILAAQPRTRGREAVQAYDRLAVARRVTAVYERVAARRRVAPAPLTLAGEGVRR